MAKRKRLSPANPAVFGAAPETKSMMARAPIADVAAEAATTAALQDVSQEMDRARREGRMVLSLPVSCIALDHIVRDRVVVDEAELDALMASIAARGQQTPIEVLETEQGQYGLISGWRRCQAIARLAQAGQHEGHVLALLRRPSDASETYQAMVEENELRVGLSYFERARVAAKAVEQGVFASESEALRALFASASRAKRSKIRSFLPLVAAFDGVLRFPHLIGERLGLKLSAALEADPARIAGVVQALRAAPPDTAEAEQALLASAVAPPEKKGAAARQSGAGGTGAKSVCTGIGATWGEGWIRLEGTAVTPALRAALIAYLRKS